MKAKWANMQTKIIFAKYKKRNGFFRQVKRGQII